MAISVTFATGTEAVSTTEHSCINDSSSIATDTTVGIYQLFLDLSDFVAGDQLQVRLYEKVRAGDTQRIVKEWIINDAQADGVWVSESFILGVGWDFTLDALAGTITVLWSIRQVA